ncbi:MAG: efflux RND transporter periplasmic adaptor subunit [Oscillospiraceae bacterium]|nr:efflux RND transporter periplasmic adaptor subunit [Oscillospiraceae bacterium]
MAETEEKQNPFQWRWVILLTAIMVSLIFLIPFIREGGARVDTSIIVDTEEAFVGSIQETVKGLAQVTEAKYQNVKTEYSGVVASVEVEEGQRVRKDTVLVRFDPQELEEQVEDVLDALDALDEEIAQTDDGGSAYLLAETSGLVKAVYAERGDRSDDMMETSGGLLELSTDGLLAVRIPLWEGAKPEEEVTVLIGDSEEQGTVSELDEEKQLATVTFPDRADYALGTQVTVLKGEEELGRGGLASHKPWLLTVESSIISEIEVSVGDEVSAGQVLVRCILEEQNNAYLALLEQREELVEALFELQEFAREPIIRAASEGVIRALEVKEGDELTAGWKLCQIVSANDFYAQVDILESETQGLRPGQKVVLTVDGAVNKGRLVSVSNREEEGCELPLCQVRVSLDDAEGLSVGITGTATVILVSVEKAILVPVEAVKLQEDGTKAVEISYGDGLNRFNKVETGLEDGTYVQILKGVDDGEDVVVASHVVETKIVQFLGREWVVEEDESTVE